MQSQPLISIIIPSYNQGRYIRETIGSILMQDYRPIEVLIMDGASTDDTLSVLRSYTAAREIKWWSEPDTDVTEAVNKGFARARGQILGIQSSDDIYLPGAFRAVVDYWNHHPEAALIYGDIEYMDADGTLVGENRFDAFDLDAYVGRFTYIPQPSAFIQAAIVQQVGGWRAAVSYAADADLHLRIAVSYPVMHLDRKLARYRYHDDQRNTHSAAIVRDWEKTIQDLLQYHRLGPKTERYARLGIHLARYKYTPASDWFRRSLHLYRAAFIKPSIVIDPRFPKRDLVIGRYPLRRFLSQLKRKIGLKPRSG